MLKIEASGLDALTRRLDDAPRQLRAALLQKADVLARRLEDKIRGGRLPAGALRDAIAVQAEDTGQGVVIAVSASGVPYAAAQEFGFHGSEAVRAHMRLIREAFGRAIAPKTIFVRQFSRTMNIPERRFMRDALEEMTPDFVDEFAEAAREVLQ